MTPKGWGFKPQHQSTFHQETYGEVLRIMKEQGRLAP
ncbi:unknown protein (plasmid) [Simkania negevensis Z]|uniref:Uncharacterized protein n=1 Tax=Simkania negevensis (strain ATCC VR-1471 / DSM 27360 / Z) TaxID=331113 RepID=F8L2S8_SIMNZ|nr:unknown protein [Simkania negevensis Z]